MHIQHIYVFDVNIKCTIIQENKFNVMTLVMITPADNSISLTLHYFLEV